MREPRVGDIVFSSFQVRDLTTHPEPVYACGPWPDCEAVIIHFNKNYGPTVGKTFTTIPTGKGARDTDYILVEQETSGQLVVRDIKRIPLYRL